MKKVNLLSMAAALLLAATGCSDDLENGSGNNGIGDGNKSSTYMKVTVNAGVVTRANESEIPPTGGEEGDGYDVGLTNEYIVKDVTVILYKNMTAENNTTQSNSEFTKDSQIVGAGYADTSGSMGGGDPDHPEHSKSATVMVKAKEQDESFDNNFYGVITVTNWGSDGLKDKVLTSDLSAIQLANLLVKRIHKEGVQLPTEFIMSSHFQRGDKVQLRANATEENAPSVDVHVERLAAKVRINPTNGVNDYIYPVGKGANETAKVRLDEVVLVNKLKSGSYLLKRVTEDVTTGGAIPSDLAKDKWLGDETAEHFTDPVIWPGKNFVIDPWTRNKTVIGTDGILPSVAAATGEGEPFMMEGGTAPALEYANKYEGSSFSNLWSSSNLTGKKKLSTSTANTKSIIIDYTRENTTSVKASQNGYSTGALFKAVYFPKQWSVSKKENNTYSVKSEDVDYTDAEDGTGYNGITPNTNGKTFYVYQGNIYKYYDAIFDEFVLEKQRSLPAEETKVYSFEDFKADNISKIVVADFVKSTLWTTTVSEPMGYFQYLRQIIDGFGNDLTNSKFSGENGIDQYVNKPDNKGKIQKIVKEYTSGETYYPYWIRHANNGKPTEMGIMEFGIVRNNVYDMTVQEIKGLGLSGIDVPEPDKEDETKDYFFKVQIYVKDWVKRNNNNITLQ